MSTQQILGVVGGVVGSFFGYPQLGFVVGSLVGGLITPAEKTEGPRVDDLKVQVSTYGAGIPRLSGTERVGGNVVWSTDKLETETTSGGKGGAPENTTYRYFVHMGIVLCETPRDGSEVVIVQMFQDGKLIYDARSGASIGSALASAENPHAFFNLYQGHADQLPDPIEEIYESGPGSVPAYRGVVRIRMNAIECPGGRVPQFSFVLSASNNLVGSVSYGVEYPLGPDAGNRFSFSRVPTSGDPATIFAERQLHVDGYTVDQKIVDIYSLGWDFLSLTGSFTPADTAFNYVALRGTADIDAICYRRFTASVYTDTATNVVCDPQGLLKTFAVDKLASGNLGGRSRWSKRGNRFAIVCDQTGENVTTTILFDWDSQGEIGRADILGVEGLWLGETYAWVLQDDDTLQARSLQDFSLIGSAPIPPELLSFPYRSYQDDQGALVCFARRQDLTNLASLWRIKALGASLEFELFSSYSMETPTDLSETAIGYRGAIVTGIVDPSTDNFQLYAAAFDRVAPAPALVSEVIADVCERVGEARYDVSEIPDSDAVIGYKRQNPASARAEIDPLLTAFAIYIVDEDGLIKFKKYEGIVAVTTIAYDELGQAEDGAEAADAMPLSRAQEVDLPRSVAVSYIEPTFDYQTASEKEVRQITEATEDMVVELPIATTPDHAKQVASMILFAKWRSQNTRSFKTSRKYAFLSPGDGVEVEYPRGTLRLWRITSMTDTGALCEFNVEPGDAELYSQTAVGATGYVSQEVVPLATPTRLQLLDIPILRDQDNNAGLYAAMAAVGTNWPGATLFVGDDDLNMEDKGSVQNEAPIGNTVNTLGNWSLGVIDETNLLTVNVSHHALTSITQDVLLTGQLNVAAVGAPGRWEIIKFQRADSLGSGVYVLSGLLRGQRGTEWARGTHQASDVFVVLAMPGILRPNLEAGSIGQVKSYRAVTNTRSLNSGPVQRYANTAEGLETFSPTNLTKDSGGGAITLNWVRRTRLSENWLAGIVPLGEASERYESVLYTNSSFDTVIRVISSTTRSAVYTTAMQAEDGYSGGPLYVRVFQISDTVGRGHPLEATI